MSRPETIERREATEPRRQEERLETVRPAQTAVIDRREAVAPPRPEEERLRREQPEEVREDPTKMGGQPGRDRPDMRTTAEMVADQEAAAAKELEEARRVKAANPVIEVELTHQRPRIRTATEMGELTRAAEKAARDQVDEQVERLRRTTADPWKHRSLNMQCSTCMWYVAKHGPANGQEVGRCRRRSPTMNGYLVTLPIDWCGDHKLDEVRI